MRSRPWMWPALTAILAIVAAALGVRGPFAAAGRLDIGVVPVAGYLGLAAGLFAAVCGLAAAGYRGSRDPRLLFTSLGAGALAAQLLLFGVVWPFLRPSAGIIVGSSGQSSVHGVAASLHGIVIGWLVAGTCFVLQWPWRDRRGRPAVSVRRACAAVLGTLVLADAAVIVWSPSVSFSSDGGIALQGGAILWVLGLLAIAALAAAGLRAWRVGGVANGAAGAALIVGSLSVAGLLLRDSFVVLSRGWSLMTGWTYLLPGASAALLFAALVGRGRSEATRMRRATDRAEEVLGGRAEIASMIAHEVRGPAATVRGIATTSLAHYDRLSDDERREFLGMIEQESRRLMTTVDQMSLALKVDARSLHYELRPVDLGEIAVAARDVAETADHPIVGFTDAGVVVSADRERMVEVVRQLLNNAAAYSPAEGPIQLLVRREGRLAVLEVIDQGPGIPAEQRERVFTRFPGWRPAGYQELPGTGLGLFISRGIVAEHSGDISVEEGPAGGTILRIRLPVAGAEPGGDRSGER